MNEHYTSVASHSQQNLADLAHVPAEFSRFISFRHDATTAQNCVTPPTRSQASDLCLQVVEFVEKVPAAPVAQQADPLFTSTVDPKNIERRRRGRPRTRAWWRCDDWAGMPVTRSLSRDEHELLGDAAYFMDIAGVPPTYMYTLAPGAIDEVLPEHRGALFHRERQTINQWLRRRRVIFHGFWALESDPPTGTGQHMHLVLHLPHHLVADFLAAAEQRHGCWPATDLRPASARPRPNKVGRFWNAATYLGKGIRPKDAWNKPISRKKVGPICGKRCGVTLPIQALIDRWKAQRQAG